MDMAHMNGKMAGNMWVIGRMVSSKGKAGILTRRRLKGRVSGKEERELGGSMKLSSEILFNY
jgi:hypothetical protein